MRRLVHGRTQHHRGRLIADRRRRRTGTEVPSTGHRNPSVQSREINQLHRCKIRMVDRTDSKLVPQDVPTLFCLEKYCSTDGRPFSAYIQPIAHRPTPFSRFIHRTQKLLHFAPAKHTGVSKRSKVQILEAHFYIKSSFAKEDA
jgi:hypothetical protein